MTIAPNAAATGRVEASRGLARSRPLRVGVRLLSLAVFGAVVGVLVLQAAASGPVLFGFSSYVITGGSMGDALPTGSIAVTRPVDARTLVVGDVISIRHSEGATPVLHRIVAVDEQNGQRVAITRGDANDANDPTPVLLSGEGDRVVYHVPYAGYFQTYVKSTAVRAVLIGLPLGYFGLLFLRNGVRGRRAAPPAVASTAVPAAELPAFVDGTLLLRGFLSRHGGSSDVAQCGAHRPASDMSALELLAALREETGHLFTRAELAKHWAPAAFARRAA